MTSVLVSGASGIVGYGILRSLRRSGLALKLIGTSIHADTVASAFCDVFELAPHTGKPGYLDWLLQTTRKHAVSLVIPGIEIDMHHWNDHRTALETAGVIPMLNAPELVTLCRDKWVFHENLRQAGLPMLIESSLNADFEQLAARYGLPFLLKPRQGFASKGIVRINSVHEFAQHKTLIGEFLMAQPIVGNDDHEYTASAFGDGAGGYHAVITMKRKLSADGFTASASVVSSEPFEQAIAVLCQRFRPEGPTNFQFRLSGDNVKLLEINPRISSSTSIRAAFGYNESAMAVEYYLDGKAPAQPVIQQGNAVRYTDEIITYEDCLHL
ncbi:MAG: ATP-grasp domain-containing protein [Burkholderiales bacterium]|nr:ATP-grasp domain-containing protein [Burkholderiales bacterium]